MRRRRIKGHQLRREWTGVESGYANGRCECGQWHYTGWTDRMRDVIRAHSAHVEAVYGAWRSRAAETRLSR